MADHTEQFPPVLDTAMVAELLGMNIQVVRRMAREGQIPSYRLPGGRTFRFFRDEIFEWLRSFPVQGEDMEAPADDRVEEPAAEAGDGSAAASVDV